MAESAFPAWLTNLAVQSFGWSILFFFIAAVVEMMFPPFPGDAVFFLGLVTLQQADLAVTRGVVAATLGGLAGFILLYWLGRAKGREIFERRNRGMFSLSKLHQIESWFKRWGTWVIICGRFLAGVRSAVPLVAGVGNYPIRSTMIFGVLSIILWNALLAVFAVVMHHNWERFHGVWQTYNFFLWVALGIVVIVIIRRVQKSKRRSAPTL